MKELLRTSDTLGVSPRYIRGVCEIFCLRTSISGMGQAAVRLTPEKTTKLSFVYRPAPLIGWGNDIHSFCEASVVSYNHLIGRPVGLLIPFSYYFYQSPQVLRCIRYLSTYLGLSSDDKLFIFFKIKHYISLLG